jgi:protein involved in polysaccharide export with SLBB domain
MQRFVHHVGICLLAAVAVCACARQTVPPVPLPPLGAEQETASFDERTYHLQPGDTVRIKFLYHPELDVKVPIRPDGGITLQMVGDIHAAGLTAEQLEQIVKERTSDRLREPEVSVIVAQIADKKIYVGGEVRVPGFVMFHQGITPLQAITDRGGFTDDARIDSVLRLAGPQNDYQASRMDLTKPINQGSVEGVELSAGDVIYVPRTFIGDVNAFVRLYIRGILPIEPRVGFGSTF